VDGYRTTECNCEADVVSFGREAEKREEGLASERCSEVLMESRISIIVPDIFRILESSICQKGFTTSLLQPQHKIL
jgi:hypothetical protein